MQYRSYSLNDLKATVQRRTSIEAIESATGCALVSEYGARLLGLFPSASQTNVLWNNKDLDAVMAAKGWQVGGERLWIAPEQKFYYENPRDFEGFHVPAGIDPGSYARVGSLAYANTFSLLDLAANELLDGVVARRTFAAVDDPFSTGLPFAGVRISDSVTVPVGTYQSFCGWSIAQVYTCGESRPGTALFPVKPHADLLSYFDPIPVGRAEVKNGYARFRIDSAAIYKLAIAPEDILFDNRTKAVYLSPYPKGDLWFSVVKRGDHIPRSQDECLDVAKNPGESRKGAIQSYNNGPGFEPELSVFGEIELQLPRAVKSGSRSSSSAVHEVLAYAGHRDEMLDLARVALGVREMPELY